MKTTSQVAGSVLPTLSATGARDDAQAFGLLAELDGRAGRPYSPRGRRYRAGRWGLVLVVAAGLGVLILRSLPVGPSMTLNQGAEVRTAAADDRTGKATGNEVLVPRVGQMDGAAVIETLPLAEDPAQRGRDSMQLQDGAPTSAPMPGSRVGTDAPLQAAPGQPVPKRTGKRDGARSVAGLSRAAGVARPRAADPVDPDVEVISAIVRGAEQARSAAK